MPNQGVNVIITGTDDLTPKINAATNAMREMEAAAKKVESSFGGGGGGGFGGGLSSQAEKDQSALRSYGMELENWAAKALKAEQASKALAASQLEAAKAAQVMAMFEQRNAEVMEHVAERERHNIRQVQPQMQPMMGGGGGGGAAAEGGMMGGMSEEFMSGINYMAGAWSIGFTLAQVALDKLGDAFMQVNGMVDWFDKEMAKSGATVGSVAGDYGDLMNIVRETGRRFDEVEPKRKALMTEGLTKPEANKEVQFQLDYLTKYGDDLTEVTAKARLFRASVEDILKIAQPGTPFAGLQAPALEYQAREAQRPVQQFQLQEAEQAEQRAFQDKTHNAEHLFSMQKMQLTELVQDRQQAESRAMEDATRAIGYEQEDRHRATQWEMEDRFRGINREMEMRHRMIEQSMADQHRLAVQREQDEDTAHSRAVSHASAISGLAENILTGSPIMGKGGKDITGSVLGAVPASYISTLKDQMEAGAKAMGLSMDAARQLVQLGVLSPGSLIQAGEEERQDERKAAARKREKEDIDENRKAQKEALDERIRQEDEIQQTERRFALEQSALHRAITQEQTQLERAHQDEQQEIERTIAHAEAEYAEVVYQAQLDMTRRYQDKRMDMERETLMGLLQLNIDYLAAKKKAEEQSQKGASPTEDTKRYKEIQDDLADSMKKAVDQSKEHNAATSDLGSNSKELSDKIDSIRNRYQDLIDKEREKTKSTQEHAQAVGDLIDKYKTLDQQYQKQAGGGGGGGGGGGAGAPPQQGSPSAIERSDYGQYGQQEIYRDEKGNIIGARAYGPKYSPRVLRPWEGKQQQIPVPGGSEEAENARIQAFALEMGLRGGGTFGPGGKPQPPSGLAPGSEAYKYWVEAHARPQEEWKKPYYRPGEGVSEPSEPRPGSRMFGPTIDVGPGLPPLSPAERAKSFFPFGAPSSASSFEKPTNQHTEPATEKTLASLAQALMKILSTS